MYVIIPISRQWPVQGSEHMYKWEKAKWNDLGFWNLKDYPQ